MTTEDVKPLTAEEKRFLRASQIESDALAGATQPSNVPRCVQCGTEMGEPHAEGCLVGHLHAAYAEIDALRSRLATHDSGGYAAALEAAAKAAAEQRCERGTPWDAACVAIMEAIRALPVPAPEEGREAWESAPGAACEGCGMSRTVAYLDAGGFVSCCPERRMLTAAQWRARALAAEAEVKRLRETLEQYASGDNWNYYWDDDGDEPGSGDEHWEWVGAWSEDGPGHIARAALSAPKETEEGREPSPETLLAACVRKLNCDTPEQFWKLMERRRLAAEASEDRAIAAEADAAQMRKERNEQAEMKVGFIERCQAAEAEAKRLREALEYIAGDEGPAEVHGTGCDCAVCVANFALSAAKEPSND